MLASAGGTIEHAIRREQCSLFTKNELSSAGVVAHGGSGWVHAHLQEIHQLAHRRPAHLDARHERLQPEQRRAETAPAASTGAPFVRSSSTRKRGSAAMPMPLARGLAQHAAVIGVKLRAHFDAHRVLADCSNTHVLPSSTEVRQLCSVSSRGMLGLALAVHIGRRAAQCLRDTEHSGTSTTSGYGGRQRAHHEVESFLQRIHRSIQQHDVDRQAGIARLEVAEHLAEIQRREGRRALDPQCPSMPRSAAALAADDFLQLCDQPHEARQQSLAGGGERQRRASSARTAARPSALRAA